MSDINYQSPIYIQLREVIRSKIEDGEYPPGTAIPSENDLAETYGINRLTVRNAVETLVNEGLLKKIQGKGVFVLGEKVEKDLDTFGGFTQTIDTKDNKPNVSVLAKCMRPAGTKFAGIFKISPAENIYYIKQLHYVNDEPYSLEEIYVPEYIVPKLEGIDLSVFSLDEVYDFYSIERKTASQTLDLTQLEQSDARVLGINSELAVMLFESISFDTLNRVIDFSRTYTRADKCGFSVTFRI